MASCPSCGVAVVPGYVKCPKCGNPLPAFSRTKSNTFGSGGGTAVSEGPTGSRLNLFIALGAGVAIAVVLVLVLGGGGGGGSKTASTTTPAPMVADDEDPATPPPPVQQPEEPTTPTAPTANRDVEARAAASELDRELKRQRLWGTVSVIDHRVDVRSGACDDAGMSPVIDAAKPRLQGAGLTKLRCLAQSGAVVFERDL